MKAVIRSVYGSPQNLELKNIEKPTPTNIELLVKVHASTVNRTDCAMLRAQPFIMRFMTGLFKPKNPILGTDFAGIVEAVGKNVTSFKVGDAIFGFDDTGLSSHAEYLAIAEHKPIIKIPKNTSFIEATASIEGAHYARNFINKVSLQQNQNVLVYGASGAIGSAIVQLLKHFKVNVTAVCGTKDVEKVKELGADKVADYLKEDFTKDTQKYEYVFDTVGKSSFGVCKQLLQPKGIYISSEMGHRMENLYLAILTPLFGKKKVVFPYPNGHVESLKLVKNLLESGEFTPLIDRTYPLGKIVEAYEYVESGQKTGNVVLTISN